MGKAQSTIPIMLFAAGTVVVGSLLGSLRTDGQVEKLRYQEELRAMWNDVRGDPSLARVLELVDDLGDPSRMEETIRVLREETGVTMWVRSEEEIPDRWRAYASELRTILGPEGELIVDLARHSSTRGRRISRLARHAPHPAFVPLLKRMASSQDEGYYVRYWALSAISQIPHHTVVEDLVSFLDVDDIDLRFRAWKQLRKLTGANVPYERDQPDRMAAGFLEWWQQHESSFEYDLTTRVKVLEER